MSGTKTIVVERTFDAPLADVWELWTTKDGLESWWGPDGFVVEVEEMDLRVGGELRYAMIARAPEQVAFMERAGMALRTVCRARYTEIVPPRRLAYRHRVDFVQGTEPYEVSTLVELFPVATGVRMVLTTDVMHDETWTQRAKAGWEMEVDKLGAVLKTRKSN